MSETVQAMPIMFAGCEGSPTKGLIKSMHAPMTDVDLHSRSRLRLKLDTFWTCSLIVISRTIFKLLMAFKLGMTVAVYAWHTHAYFDDFGLGAIARSVAMARQRKTFSHLKILSLSLSVSGSWQTLKTSAGQPHCCSFHNYSRRVSYS